jgi:hypothetical protein
LARHGGVSFADSAAEGLKSQSAEGFRCRRAAAALAFAALSELVEKPYCQVGTVSALCCELFHSPQMIAHRIGQYYRAWNTPSRLAQAAFQIVLSALIITCLVAPFWPTP